MPRPTTGKQSAARFGVPRQYVLVGVSVVALGAAAVLLARRALHEEKTLPDTLMVTCKTCGQTHEIDFDIYLEARDRHMEMITQCPVCQSEQPCYAGINPDLKPGELPPWEFVVPDRER